MPENCPKISALIITYNEMGYIERCLDSVSFADEIIVIDSFSTDGTYEYLLDREDVKVIQHPFKNFTAQKSFALTKASHDWILFLDADEVISENLRHEVMVTLGENPAEVAFKFRRQFMFKNNILHFSGWQTDKNFRLFRKSKVRFAPARIVHETLEIDGTTGCLSEKLLHFSYKDFEDYRAKMIQYGTLKAIQDHNQNKRFSHLKYLVAPAWKFIYNYGIRLGFLDGLKGLIICYLDSLTYVVRFKEFKRLEEEERRPALASYSTAKG